MQSATLTDAEPAYGSLRRGWSRQSIARCTSKPLPALEHGPPPVEQLAVPFDNARSMFAAITTIILRELRPPAHDAIFQLIVHFDPLGRIESRHRIQTEKG